MRIEPGIWYFGFGIFIGFCLREDTDYEIPFLLPGKFGYLLPGKFGFFVWTDWIS